MGKKITYPREVQIGQKYRNHGDNSLWLRIDNEGSRIPYVNGWEHLPWFELLEEGCWPDKDLPIGSVRWLPPGCGGRVEE